eukprot:COSAG02_NODE_547_length_20492_cov_265.508802_22_plen_132_part_00
MEAAVQMFIRTRSTTNTPSVQRQVRASRLLHAVSVFPKIQRLYFHRNRECFSNISMFSNFLISHDADVVCYSSSLSSTTRQLRGHQYVGGLSWVQQRETRNDDPPYRTCYSCCCCSCCCSSLSSSAAALVD